MWLWLGQSDASVWDPASRGRMAGIHRFSRSPWQHQILTETFEYITRWLLQLPRGEQQVVRLAFGSGTSGIFSCYYKFGATADRRGSKELILPGSWDYICIFTNHLSSSLLWFKTGIFHCLWLSNWIHGIYNDDHNISDFINLSIIIQFSYSGHIPSPGGC